MREVFHDGDCLLPELRMLARHNLSHAQVPGIKAHIHSDVFEIFWLERGESLWWTGEETHRLRAGQLYINRPGERHGSLGTALMPCHYFWLQLRSDAENFLPFLPREEAHQIFRVLSTSPSRCFAGSAEIAGYFARLLDEARSPSVLSPTVMRATLHLLLVQIARDQNAQHNATPQISPPIRRALALIESSLETELSSALLAREAGLSVGHFRECFRAETGFTPHAFVLRARIERAKPLLCDGENTVAAIARRLRFASSQHFATVFKKLEGVSPTQFGKSGS